MNVPGKLIRSCSAPAIDCTLTEGPNVVPVILIGDRTYSPADIGPHILKLQHGFVPISQSDAELLAVHEAGFNVVDDLARMFGECDRWEIYPGFNDLPEVVIDER